MRGRDSKKVPTDRTRTPEGLYAVRVRLPIQDSWPATEEEGLLYYTTESGKKKGRRFCGGILREPAQDCGARANGCRRRLLVKNTKNNRRDRWGTDHCPDVASGQRARKIWDFARTDAKLIAFRSEIGIGGRERTLKRYAQQSVWIRDIARECTLERAIDAYREPSSVEGIATMRGVMKFHRCNDVMGDTLNHGALGGGALGLNTRDDDSCHDANDEKDENHFDQGKSTTCRGRGAGPSAHDGREVSKRKGRSTITQRKHKYY